MSKIKPLIPIPIGNYALLKPYLSHAIRIVQILQIENDSYRVLEIDGNQTIVPIRFQINKRLIDLGKNIDSIKVLY